MAETADRPDAWAAFDAMRALAEAGSAPAFQQSALQHLAGLRAADRAAGRDPTEALAGLEAWALMAEGRHGEAVTLLRDVTARPEAGSWSFRHLAEALRGIGDGAAAARALRRSHALVGWAESEAHGYVFTDDGFSQDIPDWIRWFAEHLRAAPLRALQIGAGQGVSACWLLDRVIGPRGGRLTCVDTFAMQASERDRLAAVTGDAVRGREVVFDSNVARTGRAARLRKLVGVPAAILPRLAGETFEFLHLAGARTAADLLPELVGAWPLLAPGGCAVIDHAEGRTPGRPDQDAAPVVALFTTVNAAELEVLSRGRQVLLRRRG